MEAVLLVVALTALPLATWLGVRWQRRRLHARNMVVPGVDTGAPVAWAGAHDDFAKLHRRLQQATETARETVPGGAADAQLGDARAGLEDEAVDVDRALVAIHAMGDTPAVSELLATATRRVEAVEAAAAELVRVRVAGGRGLGAVDAALERSRLLEEARAEIEDVARGAVGDLGMPDMASSPPEQAPAPTEGEAEGEVGASEGREEPPPEAARGTG